MAPIQILRAMHFTRFATKGRRRAMSGGARVRLCQ
jgi:hypothetical protein